MAYRAAAEWDPPFPAEAHLVWQVRRGRMTLDQLWARGWVPLEQRSGRCPPWNRQVHLVALGRYVPEWRTCPAEAGRQMF